MRTTYLNEITFYVNSSSSQRTSKPSIQDIKLLEQLYNRPALKPLQDSSENIASKNSDLQQKEVVKVEKDVLKS